MLALAVRYGEGPQVFRISCIARLALSRMVAIEVRVFWGCIEGRGEDIDAASSKSWGRFYGAEGSTDAFELLFANLPASSVNCDTRSGLTEVGITL
jgi:hypothetical protein